MNYSAKNLIRVLEQKGFYYKRNNESCQIFYDAAACKKVIVPV